jgi:hypothetical protein
MEFEEGWMAFNGSCVVFREPNSTYHVDYVAHALTGASINGRAFFGGVGRYYTIMNSLGGANLTLYGNVLTNVSDSWVQWCSVRGLDILWPQYPERMMADHDTPAYDNDVGRAIEEDFKNQRGLSPTSENGTVLCVKQLGNMAIVYTSDSIWAFVPSVVEPDSTPLFGKVKLTDYGIMGRGAVCGDLRKHIFVDRLGMVRELIPSLELIERGYEEFFLGAWIAGNASEITMDWDSTRQYAYITTTYDAETRTFILTPSTLSMLGVEQVVTLANVRDLVSTGAELVGLSVVTADTEFELETDELDFGQPGLKLVKGLHVGGTIPSDLQGKIFYRVDERSAFTDSGYVTVLPTGYIPLNVSCVDCKIALSCTDYTQIQLHSLSVELDTVGKYVSRNVLTRQS